MFGQRYLSGFLRLISVSLLLLLISPAVHGPETPEIEFAITYGGDGIDYGTHAIQTRDGGFAVSGWTNSKGSGGFDLWLIKISRNGSVEWDETYGGIGNEGNGGLLQTGDGGFFLSGWTNSSGAGSYDFWLLKLDGSGNVEWNKTYGGMDHDEVHRMIITSDGGCAMIGLTYSFDAGKGDFWVVKTDSSGNMEWNATYGGTEYDRGESIIQTEDGGYAVAGKTHSYGEGESDVWLIKTDAVGNAQWNRTYGGADADWGWQVVQTRDGGFALAGETDSYAPSGRNFWLIKTDENGHAQWNQTYGGNGADVAHSIIQTCGDGYLVCGSTKSFGAMSWEFWMVKTDAVGNMQWNVTYGGPFDEKGWWDIIPTDDGGYVSAGFTGSFRSEDFLLIKTTPVPMSDISIVNVSSTKHGCLPVATVGQGNNVSIKVEIRNLGSYPEAFNVTAWANSSLIDKQQVFLNLGENITLTFQWNTVSFPYGNYTIHASADIMNGEVCIADNSMTNGLILITLPGDIDGDKDVDIFDIVRLTGVYGLSLPDPSYDPNSDIDDSGDVDIFDVVAAAGNYGESW